VKLFNHQPPAYEFQQILSPQAPDTIFDTNVSDQVFYGQIYTSPPIDCLSMVDASPERCSIDLQKLITA
jgi:hypothetical protein